MASVIVRTMEITVQHSAAEDPHQMGVVLQLQSDAAV
jgi:hypothetical protein